MQGRCSLLENERPKKVSGGAQDSSWGSLHDSELNIALKQQSLKEKNNKDTSNIEVTTDIDTDEDFPQCNLNQANDAVLPDQQSSTLQATVKHSISEDWGSMNDSQFISFINRLSQSKRDNKYNLSAKVPDTSSHQVYPVPDNTIPLEEDMKVSSTPKSKISNISSSPILLAQKLPEPFEEERVIGYQEDIMTKEDYEDAEKYAFEDHAGYFRVKDAKQQKQDKEYKEFLEETDDTTQSYPPLFENCAIHINGRTDPDILQLRKMIVLYGGKNVPYLSSKGAATHIVAESLPPRKRIQFSNCKVVTPKWIVESIAARKLLSWADYRLEQLCDYGQQSITFTKEKRKSSRSINDDVYDKAVREENLIETIIPSEEETGKTQVEETGDAISQELNRAGVDAKDPNFLPVFFSKSRLHHLSTWKSDLRSEFLNRAAALLKERQETNIGNTIIPDKRVILHVDFDCFFATVSAKLHKPPIDMANIPCCVTHGGGSADISSCNYVARKFGVKNGMWYAQAKKLCPNIVSLPYQFDEYERISNIFYAKLLSLNIDSILPVSIDEALVDVSSLCMEKGDKVMEVIKSIKHELDVATGCTVSCGCGRNVLLAKLALKRAKPNGIFVVSPEENDILQFLEDIDVRQLPGFGNRLFDKLLSLMRVDEDKKVTLKALRMLEKEKLKASFGIKMGEKLYQYSRGIDDTSIDLLSDPEKYLRKSLGIDINWGIRFNTNAEVEDFLNRLAFELSKRLTDCSMTGSMITLKLSIRHPDAPIEPPKYLGMGYCTFVSKSSNLGISTRTPGILSSELKYLSRFLNVEPKELRGVGVSMNKLVAEGAGKIDTSNQMKLQFKPATVASTSATRIYKERKNEAVFKQPPTLKPSESNFQELTVPQEISPLKRPRRHDFLNEEIDWEVFDNLPFDLQEEIRKELRKRNLLSSPKKKSKLISGGRDIAVMLSPSKKTLKSTMLHNSVSLITPEKIEKRDDKGIIFQGINISEESKILSKLMFWMDFTLERENGIDKKDLELFQDFMIKLISTNDLLRYQRILLAMSFHLQMRKGKCGYKDWFCQLEHLKSLLGEQSLTAFEFRF